MINFDFIGDNNRIPLVQIEINNSMAVTGTPPQRQAVLLFGQRNRNAFGVVDSPVRITRASQATELWGRGSMIAQMVAAFIAINPDTELYGIAQGEGTGTATSGTITLSGTATEDNVLNLYIAGRPYRLAVSKGKPGNLLADALAAMINADQDCPVSATTSVPPDNQDQTKKVITLTAKFTGECSVHDIRLNYYSGEVTPAGLVVS
ncbi:phage tail protein, partial [Escherichia coli]|nr:phage tail protein [Escherichia coli]